MELKLKPKYWWQLVNTRILWQFGKIPMFLVQDFNKAKNLATWQWFNIFTHISNGLEFSTFQSFSISVPSSISVQQRKNSEMKFIFFLLEGRKLKDTFLVTFGTLMFKRKIVEEEKMEEESESESKCVCVLERERERERESEREWDSQPIDHFNVQTFSFTSILEFLQFFFSFDSTDFEVKKFFVTFKKSWTTSQKNSSQKHSMHYRGQLDKRVYQ